MKPQFHYGTRFRTIARPLPLFAVSLLVLSPALAFGAAKINGSDIKKNSIPLNRIKGTLPAGPQGDAGPTGPQGSAGPAGPTGATGGVTRAAEATREHEALQEAAGPKIEAIKAKIAAADARTAPAGSRTTESNGWSGQWSATTVRSSSRPESVDKSQPPSQSTRAHADP